MNLIPLFINTKLDIYSPSALPALTSNPHHIPVGEFNPGPQAGALAQDREGRRLCSQELGAPTTHPSLILAEAYTPGLRTPFRQGPSRVGSQCVLTQPQ